MSGLLGSISPGAVWLHPLCPLCLSFRHLDNHSLWEGKTFAVRCFKIIMYSIQVRDTVPFSLLLSSFFFSWLHIWCLDLSPKVQRKSRNALTIHLKMTFALMWFIVDLENVNEMGSPSLILKVWFLSAIYSLCFQSQHSHLVIQQLLGHLDANSKNSATVRAGIVEVLLEAAAIAASGSVGE